MVDKTISQLDPLPAGPLSPAAVLEVEQGGGSYRATAAQIAALSGGGGGTWPPTAPDFAATVIADAAAGRFTDWVYGNVTLGAPVVATLVQHTRNIGIDMHGAKITCGFNNVAQDMITYLASESFAIDCNGVNFRNMEIAGNNTCRHGLAIISRLGQSGFYGGNLINVKASGCKGSGIYFYGSVFEYDLIACLCLNNGIGFQCRNPTAGGGTGVISSIKVIGGDYRVNDTYGIALTADTTYQEPAGMHIISADFIGNGYSGVLASSGIALILGSHFERSPTNVASPSRGAVFTFGGACTLYNCDAADNAGICLYLLDVQSANQQQVTTMQNCSAWDEFSGAGLVLARCVGVGKMVLGYGNSAADCNFAASSGWLLELPTFVQTTH